MKKSRIKMVLITLLAIVVAFVGIAVVAGYIFSAPQYVGPASEHFNGKKFFNPQGPEPHGFKSVLTWMVNRDQGEWSEISNHDYGVAPPHAVSSGMRITFVNHTTFLIQTDGVNILTDPVWSERVSPLTWIGPKRMRPPGTRFEDLPKIDVVLISHNHYDHLDLPTIKRVEASYQPLFIVPLGVRQFLVDHDVKNVVELDWWEEKPVGDSLKIQGVPAQHFSGRGMFDRDATLWCGFVIKRQSRDGNLYFAGDTGYNDVMFREIGKRCAPIAVSLLPIGAYKPNWFMSPVHVSPEEAVQIHKDVNSQVSIATHFGTFPLADDGAKEPIEDLFKALHKEGLSENTFLVLDEGGHWSYDN